MPAPAEVTQVVPDAPTTSQGPGGPGNEVDGEAGFRQPMLAQARVGVRATSDLLPGGSSCWLMEPKLDGLRGIAVRNRPGVTLYSRNRTSFNSRFPRLVAALTSLPADDFVLDGEVVGMVGGRPDFGALQEGAATEVGYHVFDLLHLLGHDVRRLPIEERKALLARLLAPVEVPGVHLVAPLSGTPRQVFEASCRDGWEGVVAKRRGSVYRSGRSPDWVKLKCSCRQELVVGGWTPAQGSREGLGALLLGYWEAGKLVYAGKVGTGFDARMLGELVRRLSPVARTSSPFDGRVLEKAARWAEPSLVVEVAFTNWTSDGRLRHPSFVTLRDDKPAAAVGREPCGPAAVPRRGSDKPQRWVGTQPGNRR